MLFCWVVKASPSFRTQQQTSLLQYVKNAVEKSVVSGGGFHDESPFI